MATSTDNSQRGTGLIGWMRSLATRLLNKGDLQGIDREEFDQIARDLNLSSSDLYAIAAADDMAVDLLGKRMADFGLSPEAVKKRHPEVLRDLQRVCGMCSSTKQCRHEFSQRPSNTGRSSYCPNTQTLLALEQENFKTDALASLPIGPSCC